jgi:hypothetical protein
MAFPVNEAPAADPVKPQGGRLRLQAAAPAEANQGRARRDTIRIKPTRLPPGRLQRGNH